MSQMCCTARYRDVHGTEMFTVPRYSAWLTGSATSQTGAGTSTGHRGASIPAGVPIPCPDAQYTLLGFQIAGRFSPPGTSLAIAGAEHQHQKILLQLKQSCMYPVAVNKQEISPSVTKQIPKTYFRAFVTPRLESRADWQLPRNICSNIFLM